ncbi:hypothetical protein [Amycolatopsis circi]|uniref:hypothetical protein n=1 Tax=Amycolatopsis circi TaxID=871959 RepID=UPI0013BE91E1|nr:hypothetical protein [Amycolatopsis circi]
MTTNDQEGNEMPEQLENASERPAQPGGTAQAVIADSLERFQRNWDRMHDLSSSKEEQHQSSMNLIHFFTLVTLLETIRRQDPCRADELTRWFDEMFEDGGAGEMVWQWRQEVAEGKEITLPASERPNAGPETPCGWYGAFWREHDRADAAELDRNEWMRRANAGARPLADKLAEQSARAEAAEAKLEEWTLLENDQARRVVTVERERDEALAKLDQVRAELADIDPAQVIHHVTVDGEGEEGDCLDECEGCALERIRAIVEPVTDREEPASGWDVEADSYRISEDHEKPAQDIWCRSESCQFRNWRSGSVPTHERGPGCPPPTASEEPASETKPDRDG